MIWHPRSDWVGTEPVTGQRIHWDAIDTIACHYTAAVNLIDGDPGEDWAGIPAYLRRIHHDYLTNRPTVKNGVVVSTGYSIGYSIAIDARGHAWELRGFDIQCAANKGHNDHTFAILFLVDGASPASPAALEAARELIGQAEQRAGRELAIVPHSALAATACCGDGIRGQIAAGLLSPRWRPTPPRPADPPISIPPISEEDEVIKLIVYVENDDARTGALVAIDGAGTEMIGFSTQADKSTIVAETGLTPRAVSAAQYDDFIAHALARRA